MLSELWLEESRGICQRQSACAYDAELEAGLDDDDVLASCLQPSLKATLLPMLGEYKSDLTKLKRKVKKLLLPSSTQTADEELLEYGRAGAHAAYANQRERLAMSTEMLINRLIESGRVGGLHWRQNSLVYQSSKICISNVKLCYVLSRSFLM